MNQKTLDLIGRHHTVEQTREIFGLARSLGFDNINMDIIVGLPGEGAAEVQETLDRIKEMDPDSLTVHSLALKRATRLNLFKDSYEPISFENSESIMEAAANCAADMGMSPYYLYRQKNMAGNFENVGYARPGKAGVYNILIMEERQSILAAGSGASTKFVFDGGRRIERAENVKDLHNYVERIDEMLERKKYGIENYLK
jgi:oxygen-independent coproporphyrinogen-3 oxidase